MHQRFLTTFFFFQPEANEYIIRQQPDTGQMDLWVVGDWDSTRAWRCGLSFRTHFHGCWHARQSSERPVCQTATRSAEKLGYSRSDRGGDGNLERPLKYQLHLCLQTHVKDFVSYWLLGLCMNVVLHWCLEIHEEIHAHTQTCVHSVYSFSPHIKFNFNSPERLALFILVARFIVLLLLH